MTRAWSVGVVSVAGAPGVSTLVAAAAASSTDTERLLVVEAAPSGGVVAARWGWPRHASLAQLAMDVSGRVDLWDRARPWMGASRVVPADPSPLVMRQAQPGGWLAAQIPTLYGRLLVDAGRVDGSDDQLQLLTAVNHRWVLLDPTVAQVAAAKTVAGWLNRAGPVGLLVREAATGPGRYPPRQVAAELGWPLVATVPVDLPAARALCGHAAPPRGLRHAPLLRTAHHLLDLATTAGEVAV